MRSLKVLFSGLFAMITVFLSSATYAATEAVATVASASVTAASTASKGQLVFWDPEVLIPLGLKALANIVSLYLIFLYVRYLHTATGPNPSRKPMSLPEEIISGAIILILLAVLAPYTLLGSMG